MQQFQNIHHFSLLDQQTLTQINQLLASAPYIDGKSTATDAAKLVKNNLQVDMNDRRVLPQLYQLLGQALASEPKFNTVLYAARVYPFLFSKCESGMGYGWHVDSPLMGGNPTIRTDLAMTIFLSDPSTYEGGELVIRAEGKELMFKPKAGDVVVYPCQYVHAVNEVRNGVRSVAVSWLQCSVRNAEQRKILADLKSLHENLAAEDPNASRTQQALQTWSNLLRMWADGV
ncbi:MAG: Fe2+-dependent dioxygenase [Bacteroidia bacterium]